MASFWPYDRTWNAPESNDSNVSQSPTKINPRWKEILEKRNSTDENTSEELKNTIGNSPIPQRRAANTIPQEGEESTPNNNLYEEAYEKENEQPMPTQDINNNNTIAIVEDSTEEKKKEKESDNIARTKLVEMYQIMEEIRNTREAIFQLVDFEERSKKPNNLSAATEMLSSLIVRLSPSFETTIHELVSDVLRDIIGRMTSIDSSVIYVLSSQLESLYSFAVQCSSKASTSIRYASTATNSLSVISLLINRVLPPVTTSIFSKFKQDQHVVYKQCYNLTMSHFKPLRDILVSPSPNKVSYTFGDIFPLGAHRLAIMEYFHVLLKIGLDSLFDEIVRLKIVEIGLNLLIEYPWNNFLHNIVTDMIVTIIHDPNQTHKLYLLYQLQLPEYILQAVYKDTEYYNKKRTHLGYMGSLSRISNLLLHEKNETFKKTLEYNTAWQSYISQELERLHKETARHPHPT